MKRAGWGAWFARLGERPQHGSALLDAMIDAAGGRYCVGPADADDALSEAEREGTVVRAGWDPTHSQRAFLGLTYRKKMDERTKLFHASAWWWTAK